MRKAFRVFAAVVGLVTGALLGYFVFVEWLQFSERNAMKISTALALGGAALAYEVATKLMPNKSDA